MIAFRPEMAVAVVRHSGYGALLAAIFLAAASAAEPVSVGVTNVHWSFQPPVLPTIPVVRMPRWPRSPIDNFILAKLELNNLAPSPEADRVTLIRRLSFDVVGLPPSPEEVDQFLADKSAMAYERLVDRLLASPRYGERWARHWLDVVRFAESNGFETNIPRPTAWLYRDYVIRCLNEDQPYDQFIREQLAGDTFGRDEATGFIVGGAWDAVKSPDPNLTMLQRADELHDMVAITGSAFLGLTVGCARCHNHKFDPISQSDYYSMVAVFAGVQHGERTLRPADYAERQAVAKEARARLESVTRKLEAFEPLARVGSAVSNSASPSAPVRGPVHPRGNVERFAPVAAKFVRFTILKTTDLEPCMDELEIFAAVVPIRNVALTGDGTKASASGSYQGSKMHKLEHINDGRFGNGHSWISNEPGRGWVQIELPETVLINRILWGRDREGKFTDRLATEYRIEVATDTNHWKTIASSDDRRPYHAGAKPELDYSAKDGSRAAAVELKSLLAQRQTTELRLQELTNYQQVYAGVLVEPEPTHRLFRGDPMEKREVVRPGTLSGFGKKVELAENAPEATRRLALAMWIADPENPLTARVMVNRLWQHHFGEGLVATPSDFGRNGVCPTHPELLDWLAKEFTAHGWSIKAMHRLILLSSTYRQASATNPRGMAVDAANRWLWRFSPARLEAEPIRDAILAVSGKLDLRMGGPGFDLFEPNDNYVKVYNSRNDFGTNECRRMIYQAKPRLQLDDTFGAFDCPDAGQIAPKRNASTTPIQALNLLHSPFILQQARFFAGRLETESGDDPKAQVRRAFRLAFGREATKDEIGASVKLICESDLPTFCRAMFNANEFLYVY